MAGRGTIRKHERGDGVRYEVVVDLGPDPATGKRRQRTRSFRTKREATAALNAWQSEIDAGSAIDRSTMSVAELMRYWLHDIAAHRVRPVTLEGYRHSIDDHIIPRLGAVRIQALTANQLQRVYSQMARDGAQPRTIELVHMRLRQALSVAVEQGLVARNVALAAHPPRPQHHEMESWSPEECQSFLDAAQASSYGPIWQLALQTGMRRGELLGLRWRDVDFDRGVLIIRQGITPLAGVMTVTGTKTPGSERAIPLRPRIVDLLRAHRARQNERRLRLGEVWSDHDLVFASDVGTPIMARNLVRDYDRWVELAGVKRIRIHDLRHTFASIALASGINPKVIAEILGHAKTSTTMDIYAHVGQNHLTAYPESA